MERPYHHRSRICFPHVNALFDVIAEALKDGADVVEATYDPILGYPITISIAYERGYRGIGGQATPSQNSAHCNRIE